MSIVDDLVKTDKAKYCFVYTPEGVDYTSGGEQILTKMKDLVYNAYPQIRTNTFLGGDGSKRDKLKAFAEGEIDMLFAMKCLDEGVDVPRSELAIFCASTGNPRQFIQRRGRILRTHKDKHIAIIHDLVVAPEVSSESESYSMERRLLENELKRVRNFSLLSENSDDTLKELDDITSYYNLSLF